MLQEMIHHLPGLRIDNNEPTVLSFNNVHGCNQARRIVHAR